MKLPVLVLVLAAMVSASALAPAAIYYQGTAMPSGTSAGQLQNGVIPDGNVGGMWNTIDLSDAGLAGPLTDIKVTLNLSGGYNGDLYAYLSYDGRLVPLLNRIGLSSGNAFGSLGGGLNNVTLSDSASVNIHAAGDGVLSGSYRPDGQTTGPLSSAASFNSAGGSITLNDPTLGFGGVNPNGAWTLFFADVVAGGGGATLAGWSLEITAVPEPVNMALGVFAGVALVAALVRFGTRLRTCPQRWAEKEAVGEWPAARFLESRPGPVVSTQTPVIGKAECPSTARPLTGARLRLAKSGSNMKFRL
jgi:hypothetical protein